MTDAPWDGVAKEPTPVRIPATLAGRVAEPPADAVLVAATPRVRKRLPFGVLLASAPWAGPTPVGAAAPTAWAAEMFTAAL